MNSKYFLFGIIFLFILNLNFVLAASNPPTAVRFANNVTADFDEGSIFVNWTVPVAGDAVNNYTIFVWLNGTLSNTSAKNTSTTGLVYTTTSEANYTFTVASLNGTARFSTNASNVSIYVDRSSPVVTLPNYVNTTAKKNTDMFILNIFVTDSMSGLTNTVCLVDVNGTNESIAISNGWCNSSSMNLTSLTDANYSIKVYVNDTVNNLALNNSYTILVDTTGPVITHSCSPVSLYVDQVITCTCSATDALAGVSTTTYTASPSTSSAGTFTATCNVTDFASNIGLSNISYTTKWKQSSSTTASTLAWKVTYADDDKDFSEKNSVTHNFEAKTRTRIKMNNEIHYVGVSSLTSTTAFVNVSSTPQEKTMSVGEEWKAEITGDNYYDILIKLNNINSGRANLTISYINEPIEIGQEEANQQEQTGGTDGIYDAEGEKKGNGIYYILGIIVVLVIIFFIWRYYNKDNLARIFKV